MNGSDLLVMAPWIVFAVVLTVLCVRLVRAAGDPGPRDTDAARTRAQEASCEENDTGTTPRAGESSSSHAGGTGSPK
jgi:hypothetical protein